MSRLTAGNASATSLRLILASTSPYRGELLQRLHLSFEQFATGVDETPLDDETPAARALRLSIAKASAVAGNQAHHANGSLIIGSDQVAELNGAMLDKPGTFEIARAQLLASSGQTVMFHTAACVIDTRQSRQHTHIDHTAVRFRPLLAAEIQRYLEREQPLDCAGSFKCEGLGISLFERIDTQDPTALIGLPLIAVSRMLRDCGLSTP